MGCNRDSNCLNIAKTKYPSLRNEIDNSANNISTQLDELISKLNTLYIPDDYLGNKVKENLEEICDGLNSDLSSVNSFTNSVDAFISDKEVEHQKHYNLWQQAQIKKKADEELITEK